MNLRLSKKWLQLLCIVLIPMLFAVGCAKREAQKTITTAEQAKSEAETAQAPRYARQTFQAADALLGRAQSNFDSGEYEQAMQSAEQAIARFESAKQQVAEVKPRVDAQLADIRDALAEAEQNLETARANDISPEQINPVAAQVEDLTQQLEEEYSTVVDEQQLNDFLAEINQVKDQTELLAKAHLKPQATQAMQEIQQLVEEAQQLDADQHAPDQFASVMSQVQQMSQAEEDGEWQTMIDLADQIRQPLDEIITIAQEQAAGDILQKVSNEIAQAKQLNIKQVDQYTNLLDQAEQTLQSGQTDLQNNEFAAAIAGANEARRLLDDAYSSLGDDAQENIQTADDNVQEAIDREAPDYAPNALNQVQQAIESVNELIANEQFVQAYRNSQNVLQASQDLITAARRGKAQEALSRAENPFSLLTSQGGERYVPEAYDQAEDEIENLRDMMQRGEFEEVEQQTDQAVEVVQQALDALETETDRFIDRAQAALDEAQEAKAQEWVGMQYANAVNLLSSAREELRKDNFLSSIRKSEAAIDAAQEAEGKAYQLRADQNISKSNDLLALAQQAEQDDLSPLAYRNAVVTRDTTRQLLSEQKYEEAYHKSEEAADLAYKALNNLVLTAQHETQSALDAKAREYSPEDSNEALALLNDAEEAQEAGNYSVANQLAMESAQLAESAEYATWKQRSFDLIKRLEGVKEKLQQDLAPIKKPGLYNDVLENLAEAKVAQIDKQYQASFDAADAARKARDQIWESMQTELQQVSTELGQMGSWIGENSLNKDGRETKMQLLNSVAELDRLIALEEWALAYDQAEKSKKIAENLVNKVENQNMNILAKRLRKAMEPYKQQDALNIVPEKQDQFNEALAALKSTKDEMTYAEAYQKYQAALEMKDQLPENISTTAQQRTEEIASILQQAQDAGVQKYYRDWYRELTKDLQWLRNSIRGDDYEQIASRLNKLEKESPQILVSTRKAVEEDEYLQDLNSYINQMNTTMQDFGYITSMSKDLIVTARSTEYKLDESVTDMYRSMQGKISARNFMLNAEELEESVKELEPPETLKNVHKKAIASFEHFRKAADGFHFYGESDAHDILYRERKLDNAYEHLYKTLKINEDLLFAIDSYRSMDFYEKFWWNLHRYEDKLADFYYSYER